MTRSLAHSGVGGSVDGEGRFVADAAATTACWNAKLVERATIAVTLRIRLTMRIHLFNWIRKLINGCVRHTADEWRCSSTDRACISTSSVVSLRKVFVKKLC